MFRIKFFTPEVCLPRLTSYLTITNIFVRVLALAGLFCLPSVALADGGELGITLARPAPQIITNPTTNHTEITYTPVQTLPYTFQVFNYNQPTLIPSLGIDFYAEQFINKVGSIAYTQVSLFIEKTGIPAVFIFDAAMLALIFLTGVVFGRRTNVKKDDYDPTADIEMSNQISDVKSGFVKVDPSGRETPSRAHRALRGVAKVGVSAGKFYVKRRVTRAVIGALFGGRSRASSGIGPPRKVRRYKSKNKIEDW